MALSAYNSDGSIIYGVGFDTADLDLGAKHIEDTLQNIITKAVNASKGQTNLFADILPKDIDTKAIDAVIAKIKQLQEEEKKLQNAIASTTDKDALAGYKAALDDIQKKLDVAPVELYKEVLAEVQKQMVDSANTVADNFQENTEKSISAVSRLRQLKNELTEKGPADPQFEALLEEATELEEKIKNVNKTLELSSNNVAGIAALKEAVRGLVGGFEALSGAIGLFGGDSEEAKKATESVIQAMGILNGIEEIGSAIAKEGELNQYLLSLARKSTAAAAEGQAAATQGLTVAEGEQIIATEGATAATAELNTIMGLNPAAVLLLAITALVTAYEIFKDKTNEAAEAQAKLQDAIAELNKSFVEQVNAEKDPLIERTKAAQQALALAQAQGKSQDVILQKQKELNDAKAEENLFSQKRLKADEQTLENNRKKLSDIDSEITGLKKINTQYEAHFSLFSPDTGFVAVDLKKLSDEQEARLKLLEAQKKAIEAIQAPGEQASTGVKDANNANDLLAAAEIKKEHDDSLKSMQALADDRLLLAKKNTQEELDARLNAIRVTALVELDNVNLTQGERKKIVDQEIKAETDARRSFSLLQLSNQKDLIQAQLDTVKAGSLDELALRISLIEKTSEIEQAADGVTSEKRIRLKADEAKAISDLSDKYAFENQELDISILQSNINARLAVVAKGSEEELSLHKQLLDNKADYDIVEVFKSTQNEELRVAKIKEILSKAYVDQKKLNDDYYDHILKNQLNYIQSQADIANAPLQQVVNSANTTQLEKDKAQTKILNNDLRAVQDQINAVVVKMAKGQGDITQLNGELDALEVKRAKLQSDISGQSSKTFSDSLANIAKYAGLASTAFNNMASAIAPLNAGLADTLSVMGKLASDAQNLATGIATGNPAQIAAAGINTITDVIGFFAQSKASAIKAAAELKSYQNSLLEGEVAYNTLMRQRALSQGNINDLTLVELEARREMLNVQKSQAQADYDAILKQIQAQGQQVTGEHTQSYGGFLGIGTKTKVVQDLAGLSDADYNNLEKLYSEGKLTSETKSWFEALQKVHDEMDAIGVSAKEELDAEYQRATGTTADSITDMIVKGFADGKSAVSDFADDTESLIRGALLNALKYQALSKPLQALYDQFAADAESNGGLDLSEVKKFQDGIAAAIQNAQTMAQQLQQATGISLADQNSSANGNSLSGAIKGMTAQQADLLAGQFGGLRITAIDQLHIMQTSLNTLNKIELNTAAAVVVLTDYYRKWDMSGIKVII